MLHLLIESGHFLDELEKVKKLKSRLFLSAVEMIEASYWLLGGNNIAQALVMLDNATELVLKGELEQIHPILIAEGKALGNYEYLKSFLKDVVLQHPAGSKVSIAGLDFERTILFETAFDRVAELYPDILGGWRKRLLSTKNGNSNALHTLRNDIVHHGGDETSEGLYVEAIIEVALPFLAELLGLVSQRDGLRMPVSS